MIKRPSSYRIWNPVSSEVEHDFHEGVYLSNSARVVECIKKGVDPNMTDDDGITALHHCVVRGDLDMIRVLLKAKGVNVNAKTHDGMTPLMYACTYVKLEAAKELLSNKANVNMRNDKEQSALHMACMRNDTKLVRLLLANGADINAKDTFESTPLSVAVSDRGVIPLTTLLLRNGANATTVGRFPLFLECVLNCNTEDRLQIIKILVHYGSDIHCLHPISQRNCLHYVGITGYLPAAKSLVKRGEQNLVIVDLSGRTPLETAWDHRNMEVFRYFRECLENRHLQVLFEEDLKMLEDHELDGDDEHV